MRQFADSTLLPVSMQTIWWVRVRMSSTRRTVVGSRWRWSLGSSSPARTSKEPSAEWRRNSSRCSGRCTPAASTSLRCSTRWRMVRPWRADPARRPRVPRSSLSSQAMTPPSRAVPMAAEASTVAVVLWTPPLGLMNATTWLRPRSRRSRSIVAGSGPVLGGWCLTEAGGSPRGICGGVWGGSCWGTGRRPAEGTECCGGADGGTGGEGWASRRGGGEGYDSRGGGVGVCCAPPRPRPRPSKFRQRDAESGRSLQASGAPTATSSRPG